MKLTFGLSLVLAIVLIGIAPPVSLAENPSNYVAVKGGLYSPSASFDLDNFNGGTTTHFDSKTGFAGEIAVGHYFLPVLAAELGAGYFESKGSPATPPGETKLRVVPVIATGKALLPLGPIEPYGEFGIGAYITELDVTGNSGNFRGSTKVTYGLHAGAGVNFNITKIVFLGVEGKYLWAKPSFGGDDIKLNGFIVTGNLGLRF
jgi:outer membrane protein W